MPVLRFPNSQSDLDRLVNQMALVAAKYPDRDDSFSLDDIRDVLATQYQISSSGASGALAVARSTRPDRSRDPLYNQVKMMSEIFRMFGWMRSTPENRLHFRMTHLGLTLALDTPAFGAASRSELIRQSTLSVVFPNQTTTNVGVVNQRPFSWLLRLTKNLGNFITRDEIIVGLLGVIDDLLPEELNRITKVLLEARENGATTNLVEALGTANGIQVNTLQNYTRLPIGILSSSVIGWAAPTHKKFKGFKTAVRGFQLTDLGFETATSLEDCFDLRLSNLEALPVNQRATIADYSFYSVLTAAGITTAAVQDELGRLSNDAESHLALLGFEPGQNLLFNAELQEVDSVLELLED